MEDLEDEIIIKCGLEQMTKAFFKDYEIIWHDPNVNSQENQQYLAQLEELCKVKTFAEWEQAEAYIKAAKTICHVITSGTNGELLVKEIFSSQNVPNIFTFCRVNKDDHSTWAKNYEKVLCTETKIEDVISQIEKNLLEWHKQTSSLKFDLPAFAPIFDDRDKSQMNHLHLYLKVIPNFQNRSQAKNDFLALSKVIYPDAGNQRLIDEFEKAYDEFNKEAVLKWYTRQSFLYKIVNNSLRIATSDSIQWSRFVLKDIERAIKDQYQAKSKDFSGLLYRAAYLSEREWSSLKANVNREIEMHGFLSVSKEKSIALKFMRADPAQKVFITIIVPKGPSEEEQGFAEVEDFSEFPREQEVLFNVRSRFTILETEEEHSKNVLYRHLVLFYGAQSLRKYVAEKNPVQQISLGELEDVFCSHCQASISEMAEKLFFLSLLDLEKQAYSCKKCLDDAGGPWFCILPTRKIQTASIKGCLLMSSRQAQTPFYGYKCTKCGEKKHKRYFVCTDCVGTLKRWCESCFGDTLNCIEMGHSIILESYAFSFWHEKMSEDELSHFKFHNNSVRNSNHVFEQGKMHRETQEYGKAIAHYHTYLEQMEARESDDKIALAYSELGSLYNNQGEYNKALEYYTKSLDIRKAIYPEQHPDTATSYANIGSFYESQGEYNKALEYVMKSLDTHKAVHGEQHPIIAASYNNIGSLYNSQGQFDKALEYYTKSFDIHKAGHGEQHPDTAISFHNLGSIYHNQGKYNKALKFCMRSLDIQKAVYGEQHPSVAASYASIGSIYNSQGEYNKALEYYKKSLDVRKAVHGEQHPHTANSYNSIGSIYNSDGEYNKALEYYMKSLDIRKAVYPEQHPEIANSYNNIGLLYDTQGEYDQAFEYCIKSLDIHKAVYGAQHPATAIFYNNIGSIYYRGGEYNKALEYFLKSLDIRKAVYGEQHPDTATSYNNIGLLCKSQGEYNKALEYYMKCLDICKAIHGAQHPDTATSYNNIGSIYYRKGEYNKALEYYMKSLDICQGFNGEQHPYTAAFYNNIGLLYDRQGKYNKGLEYFLKSLHIRKAVDGEQHPDTAASYNNIAIIYNEQGEFSAWLEYQFKSLNIYQSLYGENHVSVANAYYSLAMGSFQQQKKRRPSNFILNL